MLGAREWMEMEEGMGGINGNGKNTIKNELLKTIEVIIHATAQ